MKTRFMLLLLLSAGCGQIGANKDTDSANVRSITVGDTKVIAKCMDKSYGSHGVLKKLVADTTASKQPQYWYFNVKLEKNGNTPFNKDKVLYMNFDMQPDFTLVDGCDSIPAAFCQRIENGIKENYEYMLAFENNNRPSKPGNQTLVYKDKLFGIGTVAFVY